MIARERRDPGAGEAQRKQGAEHGAEVRLGSGPASAGAAEIALPLLLQLRWLAALGQAGLLGVAAAVGVELPYAWMSAIAAATFLSNAVLLRWQDRGALARGLPALLTADTLLLTLQLALSGGPDNPFTAFYVVHVALAAVAMNVRGTTWIAGLSGACYAAMFPWHLPQPLWHAGHSADGQLLGAHLVGMWLALSVVAAVIAYFVGRLSEQLVAARAAAARNDRLASLTALAAGAAHELGSPLGTIAVAARELERGSPGPVQEDARLIRAEVDRCREILDRMSGAAAHAEAELQSLESIVAGVQAELAEERGRVRVFVAERCRGVVAAREPIQQAIAALVRNALDASSQPVELRVTEEAQQICFRVSDRGTGISSTALAHAGEPFFTTKAPGKGTGLGLYVVRLIAERMGGELILRSAEGWGTEAVLALPSSSIAAGE